MRTLVLGIDSGTQSTKVLVVDARDGKVLASAAQEYDLIPNLPPGAKEQHPHTWRDATASAIRRALRQAKAVAAEVKAIGVSGQQHGFVPLDKDGRGHPPGQALVRHLHRRRVRGDHGEARRAEADHPRAGQRGPARASPPPRFSG